MILKHTINEVAQRLVLLDATALYLSKVEGLLSNEAKFNPDFFNWTSVFFPYCDGASFSGNRAKPLKFKKKLLYFRGH